MTDERFRQDSKTPPLHLEEGALMGELLEGDERIAAEKLQAARVTLAGTLRAVLAERLVNAPTDEFEAVKVPEKEELRAQRRKSDGTTKKDTSDERSRRAPKPDRVREAFSQLGPRNPSGARPGSTGKRS